MDDERYTSEGDPYSGMADADISPDFAADALGSASSLRNAERGASGKSRDKNDGDNQSSMKKAESDVASDKAGQGKNGGKGGGFANNVGKGIGGGGSDGGGIAGKAKKMLSNPKNAKRLAPLFSIAISMFAGAGLMYGSQSMLPFTLSHLFGNKLSSIDIASQIRFDALTDKLFNKNAAKEKDVRATISSDGELTLKQDQIDSLESHGITLGLTGNCPEADMCFRQYKIFTDASKVANEGENDIYSFEEIYNKSKPFHLAYSSAVASWRTAAASLASDVAKSYYRYRRISNWIARKVGLGDKIATAIDGHFKNLKVDSVNNAAEIDEDTGQIKVDNTDSRKAASTKAKPDSDFSSDMSDVVGQMEGGAPKSKFAVAGKIANGVSKVAKKISKGATVANFVCTALTIVQTFYLIIEAFNGKSMLNIMKTFMAALDMALTGDSSELSRVWPDFTKQYTQQYFPQDENGFSVAVKAVKSAASSEDENYAVQYDESQPPVEVTGSAATSEGIVSLFEGRQPDTVTNRSASQFNFFSTLQGLSKAMSFSVKSIEACSYAKLAASVADFVGDLASAISAVLTFGASAVVKAAVDAAVAITISYMVGQLVNRLLPTLAMHFALDYVDKHYGEDFGNILRASAGKFLGEQDQFGGGMAASAQLFTPWKHAQAEVIADRARFDRERYSPFDIRSENTFFGSIVSQFIPVSSYMGVSLGKSLSSFGNIISNSIAKLSPTAQAAGISVDASKEIEFSQKNCMLLSSVNAIGDPFCNKYVITDVTTTGTDPTVVDNSTLITSDVRDDDNDGKYEIEEGSNLGKWLKYCGRRTSPIGAADQNIAADLGVDVGFDVNITADDDDSNDIHLGISDIPIVGSFVDIINNSKAISNAGYIPGESCVLQSGVNTKNNINGVDISERKTYEDNVAKRRELWAQFLNGWDDPSIGHVRGAIDQMKDNNKNDGSGHSFDSGDISTIINGLSSEKKTALANTGVTTPNSLGTYDKDSSGNYSFNFDALKDSNTGDFKDDRAKFIAVKNIYDDFIANPAKTYGYTYTNYYYSDDTRQPQCADSGASRCYITRNDSGTETNDGKYENKYYSTNSKPKNIGWDGRTDFAAYTEYAIPDATPENKTIYMNHAFNSGNENTEEGELEHHDGPWSFSEYGKNTITVPGVNVKSSWRHDDKSIYDNMEDNGTNTILYADDIRTGDKGNCQNWNITSKTIRVTVNAELAGGEGHLVGKDGWHYLNNEHRELGIDITINNLVTGCNSSWDSSEAYQTINFSQCEDSNYKNGFMKHVVRNSGVTSATKAIDDLCALHNVEERIAELDKQIFDYEAKIAGTMSFDAIVRESATGDEARVYHRWAQDQRLFNTMGYTSSNLVQDYYDKLDAANPPENMSELDILARDSGLTKENVIATIEGVDLLLWIADYHPSGYYPTPTEIIEEPEYDVGGEEERYESIEYLAHIPQQFLEDRRQRNYAV
ncbi:hypothetical protein IJ847_01675 [Candidatus Saccharibacteria bacterium]|nr:hypothetical protein [Candidatus Saccharibacteria bacterium]